MGYLHTKLDALKRKSEQLDALKTPNTQSIIEYLQDLTDIIGCLIEERQDDASDDDAPYDYLCPNCGKPIKIDETEIKNEDYIICPKCNEPFVILTNEL